MTIAQHFTLAGASVEDAGEYFNIEDKVLLPKTAGIVEARNLAVTFNVPFIEKLPEPEVVQAEPLDELLEEALREDAPKRRGRKPEITEA
jgi:hypothetical protein